MDLQLAYLGAPASAAAANAVQQSPSISQQATQAAFANQVEQRQETVEETPKAEGAKIRADQEGRGDAGTYNPRKRRQRAITDVSGVTDEIPAAGEQHFIDTTA